MLVYSFKTLWNRTFLFVGPLWFVLVYFIWASGQLEEMQDKVIFFSIVIPGFIATYLSGFLIEKWHRNKKKK
ncbi:MAG TPA: hypothetical protein ENN50_00095 [Prosthecochloris aestuarii]|uniref:Uncharacterized protein n=1 Tax=Prosthecochloris aestuarii TaxID=1102 RepID=A0A831SQC3_PROAE|nr:hypothetical protein [Prosthecochloris aestuarii]